MQVFQIWKTSGTTYLLVVWKSSGSRLEVVWTSWKSSDKVVWTSCKVVWTSCKRREAERVGSFAAEIRDSSARTRIWLGTFATARGSCRCLRSSRYSSQGSPHADEFSDSSSSSSRERRLSIYKRFTAAIRGTGASVLRRLFFDSTSKRKQSIGRT
ncbi:hypothetical protein Bca101_099537 [Brassica carinata]